MNAGVRVLGIDPGLKITGYAVIEGDARHPVIVEAGMIRVAGKTMPARLNDLFTSISDIFTEHCPTAVAVEELYSHYQRPRVALLMGHARGVLLLAAQQAGVPVCSYLPTRVKKLATGNGRASKEQMQLAVQGQFGLPAPPEPPDVADALAIALCHIHVLRAAA